MSSSFKNLNVKNRRFCCYCGIYDGVAAELPIWHPVGIATEDTKSTKNTRELTTDNMHQRTLRLPVLIIKDWSKHLIRTSLRNFVSFVVF